MFIFEAIFFKLLNRLNDLHLYLCVVVFVEIALVGHTFLGHLLVEVSILRLVD